MSRSGIIIKDMDYVLYSIYYLHVRYLFSIIFGKNIKAIFYSLCVCIILNDKAHDSEIQHIDCSVFDVSIIYANMI